MEHPEWALKHKRKGTELRCIRGKYYLYEVSSQWDKVKKRAKKITGKCIGSISENGLTPTKNTVINNNVNDLPFRIKKFGSFYFFLELSKDIIPALKKYFPDSWKQLLCIACTRLFNRSAIKNMPFYFEASMFSEYFSGLAFSDKTIGALIHDTGRNQDIVEGFMREFIPDKHLVIIDATPIFSKSKNIYEAQMGYNNKKVWENQVNLLYLYDPVLALPLFYRLTQGDIREVKTLELAIITAGLRNAIVVGDKGFTSELNMEIIEQSDFSYILPLKRNSSYIDYKSIDNNKMNMDGFFKYKKRYIWFKESKIKDKRRVIVFLDDQLRISEEQDYLDRIERKCENYSKEEFLRLQPRMGTITIIDNICDREAKEIYYTYKSRCEIEQLFDIFKNELSADTTYMHSIESLKGWLFINHLALMMYYRIFKLLKDNDILDKYSVDDVIAHLEHIYAVDVNTHWKLCPSSHKSSKLLKSINVNIPITWIKES